MEYRFVRAPAPVLSPLEESSEEVSRDSGIVSQSTSTVSTVSMISEALSAGEISQSPSFSNHQPPASPPPASPLSPGLGAGGGSHRDPDQEDEMLTRTARGFASYIRAEAGEEVRTERLLGATVRVLVRRCPVGPLSKTFNVRPYTPVKSDAL